MRIHLIYVFLTLIMCSNCKFLEQPLETKKVGVFPGAKVSVSLTKSTLWLIQVYTIEYDEWIKVESVSEGANGATILDAAKVLINPSFVPSQFSIFGESYTYFDRGNFEVVVTVTDK